MANLEAEFDEAMMNIYRTAKNECGYNATYFLQMLNDWRGVATARHLVANQDAQYGFTKLWEHGRLDITVECLMLNQKFKSLFEEDELERARRRLKEYNFDPAKCEQFAV